MPQEKYLHITDAELLQLYYNDKDNKWVGILLQRYTLLLLGTCMKYLKNEEEAKEFIQQIVAFLKLPINSKVLDLACGKGRHAQMFCQHGMQVLGVDLSPNSIAAAKQLENDKLSFSVHDMREPIVGQKFDLIANLFTSFGYFDDQRDNQKAFDTFSGGLKIGGLLVVDFFNPTYVLANLMPSETVECQGISFRIKRWSEEGYLYKSIEFTDQGFQNLDAIISCVFWVLHK